MVPRLIIWRSEAIVTPPAVSAKTPSVFASSSMHSRISESGTEPMSPPWLRSSSRTYGPSAGLPIASERAIVFGRCGVMTSAPSLKAVATGEQPVACAPNKIGAGPSTRPSSMNSLKPLATLVSWLPEATGTTTCAGSFHPSCSVISKASVFDPSA